MSAIISKGGDGGNGGTVPAYVRGEVRGELVGVRMQPDMLAQIDALRGGRSRAEVVRSLLPEVLPQAQPETRDDWAYIRVKMAADMSLRACVQIEKPIGHPLAHILLDLEKVSTLISELERLRDIIEGK